MADKSKKVVMPLRDEIKRIKDFNEVAVGYNEAQAKEEAQRCLMCRNRPCMDGCPVHVKIPEFIKLISQGRYREAYDKIKETNNLPAVCGRVCPQENQCEALCTRGKRGEPVGIGNLERFAADYYINHNNGVAAENKPDISKKVGHKIAIIGSGPAGLSCAGDLAKWGYDVTVFEALHDAGGVLMYGIPEFRLPKYIVQNEIENLKRLGVKIEKNMVIGKTLSIDDIFDLGYEAVFIGSGAGLPSFMGIPGENLNCVYSANEFLTRINLMKAYNFPASPTPILVGDNVAVVGGGNVAMDAARCALRLGAKNVHILYRRTEQELPARKEEVKNAEEEGVIFDFLKSPVEIIGDDKGFVKSIKCVEMELGEIDASGRRRPIPKKGSQIMMDMDTVIIAIGQSPNPLLLSSSGGIKSNKKGCIIVNEENLMTSKDKVFAGGDAVTGAATVILAMGAGKKAAVSIDKMLKAE